MEALETEDCDSKMSEKSSNEKLAFLPSKTAVRVGLDSLEETLTSDQQTKQTTNQTKTTNRTETRNKTKTTNTTETIMFQQRDI